LRKKYFWWLDSVLSCCLFIIIWQFYISSSKVPVFMMPSPVQVFQEVSHQILTGNIWLHFGITSLETIVGFSFAAAFGLLIGYIIYKNKTVRITIMPFLIFFQVAPKIALVPIFIIWFGLGFISKIFVVFSMVFFPVILGMVDGLGKIPSDMKDYMRILKANRGQFFFSLELPYALPSILASFKVGIIQALIGATVAEWMSGQNGLGYLQTFASSTFNTPLLMTGIFFTIILGMLLFGIISLLERHFLKW
jgi:NitT/TauT family transport system permease protein